MTLPSVKSLEMPTLQLIARGVSDPEAMRERLIRRFRIPKRDLSIMNKRGTAVFTNSHAWALVGLQRRHLIEKTGDRSYRATQQGIEELGKRPPFGPPAPPQSEPTPQWVKVLLSAARTRNKRMDVDYRYSREDLINLWNEQDGLCALTGAQFDLRQVGGGQASHPFMPSLDRIDPTQGYEPGNVRLVMQAINFALNRWGDDVYFQLAKLACNYNAEVINRMPPLYADSL